MDVGSGWTFFQRRSKDSQKTYEKMLIITHHQRNENQNHYEITLNLSKWLKSKRQISVGKNLEKRETSYTVGGSVNWYSHCGKHCGGGGSLEN